MWDTPGPGIELVSATLQGGLLTTAPPGEPQSCYSIESLPFAVIKEINPYSLFPRLCFPCYREPPPGGMLRNRRQPSLNQSSEIFKEYLLCAEVPSPLVEISEEWKTLQLLGIKLIVSYTFFKNVSPVPPCGGAKHCKLWQLITFFRKQWFSLNLFRVIGFVPADCFGVMILAFIFPSLLTSVERNLLQVSNRLCSGRCLLSSGAFKYLWPWPALRKMSCVVTQ